MRTRAVVRPLPRPGLCKLGAPLLVGAGAALYSGATPADCTLGRIAEAPVVMVGMRPTVKAQINGAESTFLIDSGAFFSDLTRAAAAQFNLRLALPPSYLRVKGVGGEVGDLSITTVRKFTLFGIDIPDVDFIVAGSDPGANVAGLIGQNILRIADVEYDLANGTIRLLRPKGCEKSALAYWATSQPFSQMDIDWATRQQPHTTGTAFLNGVKLRIVFDTGASHSLVTLHAARRAGVRVDSPGVVEDGLSYGLGRQLVKSWIAPVESFRIGDEEIRHTRLRIADFTLIGDMLLGADFFLSHRIYVASSQRKLYFTYNGGPVFDLRRLAPNTAPGVAVASASDTASPAANSGGDSMDAAAYSRRGVAFSARHDYVHALADLTRACQLDPTEASYFYERGLAHRDNGEASLALADFDEALKLRPNDALMHLARAELHVARHEGPAALSDLDAADRLAAPQADLRLRLGALYSQGAMFEPAIRQYELWMKYHRDDVRMSEARGRRCGARAMLNVDLEAALADCSSALRRLPRETSFVEARAFVELRLRRLDRALADFDQVVQSEPRNAWALYGRGVTKLAQGSSAAGRADIDAARALQSNILEVGRARQIGSP